MSTLLELTDLSAGYGASDVIHGLNMKIEEGSITTLLGSNGAGKTSTLRAICKMIRTRGQMVFEGKRLDGLSTEDIVRLGVAHVPDGRGTFTSMSAEENLRLGSYTRKDKRAVAEDQERMFHYFPRLKERRHQQAGTLSGGEQQMLAIARALMLRPRLLLLDEPSFGLAPLIVKEIFGIMRTINETEKVTILLVEQNAAMALDLAHQAYLIETGRLAMSGPAQQLKQDEAVRRAYLGY
ncbi:MAG: ABC transporter ATP-binding protein [Limnohabitans sp.]|jgi:branched-chain amino acid transport system ATP-binding protein|nr:ABC transporter ATP-binding protein [Limnohabitans sp.]